MKSSMTNQSSPQQASDSHPASTGGSNSQSGNYQQSIQHFGAWSQTQTDYPASIDSDIPEDADPYSIRRYQEQKPKDDPWSPVTSFQK